MSPISSPIQINWKRYNECNKLESKKMLNKFTKLISLNEPELSELVVDGESAFFINRVKRAENEKN